MKLKARKLLKKIAARLLSSKAVRQKETEINFGGAGLINFIDIGSVGNLPHPWKNNAHHIKHLLKFEPRDKSENSVNVTTISAALWDQNVSLPFYIYKGFKHTGSSLFEQNLDYVRDNFESLRKRGPSHLAETWFERSQLVRVESLECKTLDSVISEHLIPQTFHFIKIDAQGAEYQILRGAESILKKDCIALHLELFQLPLYKGIKLLPEVCSYLKDFGFDLVKQFPPHGSFDSQHDCLFIKSQSADKRRIEIIRKVYEL